MSFLHPETKLMFTIFKPLKATLLALSLGLAACSTEQAVQTDQRSNVDFTAYKTYNFMDEMARNDSTAQGEGTGVFEVKRAVAREMESRGYQRAAQPDLWVNIGIITQQKAQTRETNYRFDGAPQYIGQRNYHWQAQDVVVGQYQQGTATVDIVDAARKEQLWQGTTTSILSKKTDKSDRQIDEAVTAIFKKYPVPPRQ
jgi:hypothetical protein